MAAAAPATSAMPTVATNTMPAGGNPGTARNMPITAQKTMSDTTRGLVEREELPQAVFGEGERQSWTARQ